MQVRTTRLPGVVVIELKSFSDDRGFFRELFRENMYTEAGLPHNFVQYNHSRSKKNVLRGMHYQRAHAQGKLVTAVKGHILDVVADVRPESPTFGVWIAEELSDQNHHQLYVPPGYAHGFLALSDEVDLLYACTDYYHHQDAFTVNWKDPTLNIQWPIVDPILSTADKEAPFLSELTSDQLPIFSSND